MTFYASVLIVVQKKAQGVSGGITTDTPPVDTPLVFRGFEISTKR